MIFYIGVLLFSYNVVICERFDMQTSQVSYNRIEKTRASFSRKRIVKLKTSRDESYPIYGGKKIAGNYKQIKNSKLQRLRNSSHSCFGHNSILSTCSIYRKCILRKTISKSDQTPVCKCVPRWIGQFCQLKLHSRSVRSSNYDFKIKNVSRNLNGTDTMPKRTLTKKLRTNLRINLSRYIARAMNLSKRRSVRNTTNKPRDVCEGIHPMTFSCMRHGRCYLMLDNDMPIPTCECDPSWKGQFCNIPCSMNCTNGGVCQYNATLSKEFCSCPKGFGGQSCSITIPPPTTMTMLRVIAESSKWVVVGPALGVLFLVLVGIVLILFIMWRKRTLVIMKLVHRFQRYEDDDDREYDAFISYKSSSKGNLSSPEELFVATQLLTTLEKEWGFRICVHFRDFIPGLSIGDNVLHAIQSSRRTIMLLSEAYINGSEWCRFEYQQAQVAMLQQKQRIIPVLYEDISHVDIKDPTLKLILQSITYIEKPSDVSDIKKLEQFWTRLQLSMPKKRDGPPVIDGSANLLWQESCDSARTDITILNEYSHDNKSSNSSPSYTCPDSGIEIFDLLTDSDCKIQSNTIRDKSESIMNDHYKQTDILKCKSQDLNVKSSSNIYVDIFK